MIIDTSALCGVLFEEPEAATVVESRRGTGGLRFLNELLQTVEVAQDACRSFGKGRHAAGLNFADCAAYALAKVTNQPLLYKGDDFS